jgi:2-polyprenyl-6-hydroxyphenyl methylase / 3-demethylubiquinone-9 3-methyltransferase
VPAAPRRPRNDPRQYDDLADEWWRPRGEFAALHWLARARGALIPPSSGDGATLLDLGCGGGLLAPHVPPGYRHVGVDLSETALAVAAQHGIEPVRADVGALPFEDGAFDVVVAGEVLEHVTDLDAVVAEACRVLRPGGVLVCDTIADTRFARLTLVTIGERVPGGPPLHCHDPALFVSPDRLRELCARGGVDLRLRGLRPSVLQFAAFLLGRRDDVTMVPTRPLNGVIQGIGSKPA